MKIVAINAVDYGSTGRIMLETAQTARKEVDQYQTYSMARKDKHQPADGHRYYLSYRGYMMHYIFGRITGGNGFFSIIPTIRLVHSIKKFRPDIVHLHNIHGFCINMPILFRYLRISGAKTVWTLHDCWTITGHCAHYDSIGCAKWQKGCGHCPKYTDYPQSAVDNSKWMWKYKKKHFADQLDPVLITPSVWLADQVRQSYLGKKEIRIIHNGIDLELFRPTDCDLRNKYHLEGKYVVLGVAFGWGYKKGLDVFQRLAETLPEKYKVVLVGTTEKTDKLVSSKIISIHRTNDQKELAGIYSTADVFVNATREDTFPTVNIEALACGTPVITFRTGGSPEIIDDKCGIIVEKDDYDQLQAEVIRACETQPFSAEDCIQRAHQYDVSKSYSEYCEMYRQVFMGEQS